MTDTKSLDFISVQITEGLAKVLLNRPDRLNAASPVLVSELRSALAEVLAAGVAVVVISGEGRAFCAGHDLKEPELTAGSPEFDSHLENLQEITNMLRDERLVSIAAVHGFVLGAGLEIALSCDFVIAEQQALLGFPEVSVGLSVTGGISYLLPQAVGLPKAKELILLGEKFTALEAQDMGLINFTAHQSDLIDEADALARSVLEKPRTALMLAKRYLEAGHRQAIDQAMTREVVAANEASMTGETSEAITRFGKREA